MSAHPSQFDLEAHHAGERSATVAQHLEGCPACRATVDRLSQARSAFRAREPAEDVVRRLRVRADSHSKRRVWTLAPLFALAAAALVVFVLRPPDAPLVPEGAPLVDPRDTVRLKGDEAVRLAAIVHPLTGPDRRVAGDVVVAPGERLRLELQVTTPPTLIIAADEDGSLQTLVPETAYAAGVHFPERTLTVGAGRTDTWLIVATPEAMAALRAGREAEAARLHVTSP